MKKVVFGIIIISLISISLLILCNNISISEINADNASVSSEEIINFNKKFENFSKLQNHDELKEFLEFCKLNCGYYECEPVFVPVINYISNDEEICLTYKVKNNYSFKDTEYYVELEKLIEKVKENKLYSIEFSYIEVREDRPQMLRQIKITEKNENN